MTKFQAWVCFKDEFGQDRTVSPIFEPAKLCNQKLDQDTTLVSPASAVLRITL